MGTSNLDAALSLRLGTNEAYHVGVDYTSVFLLPRSGIPFEKDLEKPLVVTRTTTLHIVWQIPEKVNPLACLRPLECVIRLRYRMEKTGKMEWASEINFAKFDEDDRIYIPVDIAERAGLQETARVECWLFVVTVGRYRLIPKSALDINLAKIGNEFERIGSSEGVFYATENNEEPATLARWFDCPASPQKSGWRIAFPKAAKEIVPSNEERSHAFVLIVAGYVELWFPDTLRRAVSVPMSKILP
jgi:hypothetical protein